ncbi:hypothetical protein RRF57_007148 [Xylaria bambusicola]|uniref:Uncharacterized protein n=1 Tax=Xylaria bambusicola TaxID=326684 RepID=A0AAN7UQ54_9PEZI
MVIVEATGLHPGNNPHLDRNMFFVVDKLKYNKEGIFLVQMNWDKREAKNKGKSYAELADLGRSEYVAPSFSGRHEPLPFLTR